MKSVNQKASEVNKLMMRKYPGSDKETMLLSEAVNTYDKAIEINNFAAEYTMRRLFQNTYGVYIGQCINPKLASVGIKTVDPFMVEEQIDSMLAWLHTEVGNCKIKDYFNDANNPDMVKAEYCRNNCSSKCY